MFATEGRSDNVSGSQEPAPRPPTLILLVCSDLYRPRSARLIHTRLGSPTRASALGGNRRRPISFVPPTIPERCSSGQGPEDITHASSPTRLQGGTSRMFLAVSRMRSLRSTNFLLVSVLTSAVHRGIMGSPLLGLPAMCRGLGFWGRLVSPRL